MELVLRLQKTGKHNKVKLADTVSKKLNDRMHIRLQKGGPNTFVAGSWESVVPETISTEINRKDRRIPHCGSCKFAKLVALRSL